MRGREQKAERNKVAIDALEEKHEATIDKLIKLSGAIDELPDASPDATWARLLIALNYDADLFTIRRPIPKASSACFAHCARI